MRLHTARLLLRPYLPTDLEPLHAFASDPRISAFVEWGPNSRQDSRDFLASCHAEEMAAPRAAYTFAVAVHAGLPMDAAGPDQGAPFGSVGLTLDQDGRTGEVGYVIAAERRGCGYATEAAAAVVRLGFDTLGLARLRATCRPENAASARVLEKLGMSLQGRLVRHKLIRGRWKDSLLFSIDR